MDVGSEQTIQFLMMAVQILLAIVVSAIGFWVRIQAQATDELRQKLHDTQINLARDYTANAGLTERINLSIAPVLVEIHRLRTDLAHAGRYRIPPDSDTREDRD